MTAAVTAEGPLRREGRERRVLLLIELVDAVLDQYRVEVRHRDRARRSDLDADRGPAFVEIDMYAAPRVDGSRGASARRSRQLEVSRERLASPERDLQVALLHRSTPYAVTITRR
jgi:hypothetical protein